MPIADCRCRQSWKPVLGAASGRHREAVATHCKLLVIPCNRLAADEALESSVLQPPKKLTRPLFGAIRGAAPPCAFRMAHAHIVAGSFNASLAHLRSRDTSARKLCPEQVAPTAGSKLSGPASTAPSVTMTGAKL